MRGLLKLYSTASRRFVDLRENGAEFIDYACPGFDAVFSKKSNITRLLLVSFPVCYYHTGIYGLIQLRNTHAEFDLKSKVERHEWLSSIAQSSRTGGI